jgi:hypothetical protein
MLTLVSEYWRGLRSAIAEDSRMVGGLGFMMCAIVIVQAENWPLIVLGGFSLLVFAAQWAGKPDD